MDLFIESLKRLYNIQELSKSEVDRLLKDGKITSLEHLYILGEVETDGK